MMPLALVRVPERVCNDAIGDSGTESDESKTIHKMCFHRGRLDRVLDSMGSGMNQFSHWVAKELIVIVGMFMKIVSY